MAYNFSLKKYANGTVQLTYYDFPILDSFDKSLTNYDGYDSPFLEDIRSYDDCDNYTPWGYEDAEIINMGEKTNDCNENSVLSDEELAKRHERSLASSLNRSLRKIYDFGRNNTWDWFFTFTLNTDAVKDRKDYSECSKKVCTWFNNLRKRKCPNMKYLIVPEKHPSSGAWHFHALVSNVDNLEFKVAINNEEFRKDKKTGQIILNKKGQPKRNKYFGQELRVSYPNGNYIYNIVNFDEQRYGFSQATKIVDTRRAVSYIVKYLTKELSECTFGKRRYFPSNNLTTPEVETVLDSKSTIQDIISWIEEKYNVTLLADYIKTVNIRQPNYSNTVSYLEFDRKEVKSG